MKASELRIGNYVNVPIKEQCPFRIDAFEYCSEKFIKVAQEVKLNGFEVHPLTWYGGDLQPIPLTEEWFLKFGLIKTKEGIILMGCYQIVAHEESWRIILKNGVLSNIKYVHQLQNLYFALTGEELTIKQP
jgi:hypothetical protein